MSLLGERIDQLMSLDVASRNVIHLLYGMGRRKIGAPLCMSAARLLVERVSPGDVVVLVTGWPDRPHITPQIAETDGPPGAALLARALHRGLGAVPLVLIEEHLVGAMSKVLQSTGLKVLSLDEAIASASSSAPIHGAAVLGMPHLNEAAEAQAAELLSRYRPSAVIAVEKGGANEFGVVHTSRGADTTEHMAKADHIVRLARAEGIATIGIGDGGNEIGMGLIADEIREKIPFGRVCKCGCGGGIAPSTEVDVLVTAAISNWGAYGVGACLAGLLRDQSVFHDAAVEERVLRAAADAGLIDGITGYVDPGADGVGLDHALAFVGLMQATLLHCLSAFPARRAQEAIA